MIFFLFLHFNFLRFRERQVSVAFSANWWFKISFLICVNFIFSFIHLGLWKTKFKILYLLPWMCPVLIFFNQFNSVYIFFLMFRCSYLFCHDRRHHYYVRGTPPPPTYFISSSFLPLTDRHLTISSSNDTQVSCFMIILLYTVYWGATAIYLRSVHCNMRYSHKVLRLTDFYLSWFRKMKVLIEQFDIAID